MVRTSRVLSYLGGGLFVGLLGTFLQLSDPCVACAQGPDTRAEVSTDAKGEEAFRHALARLQSAEAGDRASAADELGRRGYRFRKPIAEALRPILLSDPQPVVRAAAGRALGRLGAREAIPELIQALSDASSDVRVVAAAALWRLPDPSSVPALLERTNDEDRVVREWAALALGVAADARALPALLKLLDDRERAVRLSAVRSLGRIERAEALEPLVRYLATPRDEEEREEVVNSVASIPDEQRVPSLLMLYANAGGDVNQKRRLLAALGKVGDERAISLLRKASSQRELRVQANKALAELLARASDAGTPSANGVDGAAKTATQPDTARR
jgi:HEAT repeat protein